MSYPRISFYTLTFFRQKTCIALSECTLLRPRFYTVSYYILATPDFLAASATAAATVLPTRGSKALGMM